MGRTYRMPADENVFLKIRAIICAVYLSGMITVNYV
jgi:hypothetical protein